jgi:hypothetical protein
MTKPTGLYSITSNNTKAGSVFSTLSELAFAEQHITDNKIKKLINLFIIPCMIMDKRWVNLI